MKDRRTRPRWYKAGEDHVAERVEQFRLDVRAVATRTARFRGGVTVEPKDVDAAFDHLAAVGLERRPLWRRPQFTATLGGLALGFCLAAPDMLPPLLPDGRVEEVGVLVGIIAPAILAVGLTVRSWLPDAR